MEESKVVSRSETSDVLGSLCGSDNVLHEALSNFLFLDPRREERHIGSIAELWEEGTKAIIDGNRLKARLNFEIIARLGLYYQDRVSVEKILKLAEQVTEDETRYRMHQTLLSNLDTALSIAEQYYKQVYPGNVDEQKTKKSKVLEPATIPVTR